MYIEISNPKISFLCRLAISHRNTECDALKIADFGLAIVIKPEVPERLKCGSPGYVAPEVLNNLGYNTKADIFSAGIMLYIMLTGVFPFRCSNVEETLKKNKEGDVSFEGKHWKFISTEAKDLVSKMVHKDLSSRYSATEALAHPWFTCAHTKLKHLSNAQENMKKYNGDEERFNVNNIKPEFSMLTCTPLLNSKFAGKDSPLLAFTNKLKNIDNFKLEKTEDRKVISRREVVFRDINQRFNRVIGNEVKAKKNVEEGNLDENEINENPEITNYSVCNNIAGIIPSTSEFVPGKLLIHSNHLNIPTKNKIPHSSPSNIERKLNATSKCYFQGTISNILGKEDGLRPRAILTKNCYISLETKSEFKFSPVINIPKPNEDTVKVNAVYETFSRQESSDAKSIASELKLYKESFVTMGTNFEHFVTVMSHQSSSQAHDVELLESRKELEVEEKPGIE